MHARFYRLSVGATFLRRSRRVARRFPCNFATSPTDTVRADGITHARSEVSIALGERSRELLSS
eukprot:5457746-Pleurochrysis_carterae.AAC.1